MVLYCAAHNVGSSAVRATIETNQQRNSFQSINQSIKLFYSAPKSWPESWPT